MFVLLDSLSRAHFKRALPNSHRFLRSFRASVAHTQAANNPHQSASPSPSHVAFMFNRYNIIGDHSAPNMAGLFTGRSWGQLWSECHHRDKKNNTNTLIKRWIWRVARQKGYMTSLATEDCNVIGGHPECFDNKGFDLIIPPMYCSVDLFSLLPRLMFLTLDPSRPFCKHDRLVSSLLFNFSLSFIRNDHTNTYSNNNNNNNKNNNELNSLHRSRPKFSVVITNEAHQPRLSGAQQLDAPLLDLLRSVLTRTDSQRSKHSEHSEHSQAHSQWEKIRRNTILFLLADHGNFQEGYAQTRAGTVSIVLSFSCSFC